MPPINNLKDRFVVLLTDSRINSALLESQLDRQRHHLVWTRQQDEILTLVQRLTFDLIVLAFNKNALGFIKFVKSADGLNSKTPVIALMDSADVHQRKKLIDAGFDDCLTGNALESQVCEVINYWNAKKNTAVALNYIQLIQNKTKYNQHLTLTIFNKLFEELPWQIEIIEEALNGQQYARAEETVHKLHGSVCFCDLEDIRAPAHALENCLINKNYDVVTPYFMMLQECVLNFTSYQRSILANL